MVIGALGAIDPSNQGPANGQLSGMITTIGGADAVLLQNNPQGAINQYQAAGNMAGAIAALVGSTDPNIGIWNGQLQAIVPAGATLADATKAQALAWQIQNSLIASYNAAFTTSLSVMPGPPPASLTASAGSTAESLTRGGGGPGGGQRGGGQGPNILPWVIGGLGVVGLGVGIYLMMQKPRGRRSNPVGFGERHRRSKKKS